MDWLRHTLIIGMIGVLIALLFEYQSFEPPIKEPEPQLVFEQPEASVPSATTYDDVPTTTSVESQTTAAPSYEGGYIEVVTDKLMLNINLEGGDIEFLSLQDHMLELGSDTALPMLMNNAQRTYIAQSGLAGTNGTDVRGQRAQFHADGTHFELTDDNLVVDLHTHGTNNVHITKRFTFERGSYAIKVEYIVDNRSESNWSGALYGYVKRDGLEPIVSSDGMQPFLGMATTNNDDNYYKADFDDIEDEPYRANVRGGWIAMVQHYYVSAWVPHVETQNLYYADRMRDGLYRMGFTSEGVTVPAGEQATLEATFYSGPKDQDVLADLAEYLDLTVDYSWLWWLAKPMFNVLEFFYGLLGNWGFAIIALTILIKAVLYYPSAVSYRSMAAMRKFSPRIQEIRERFGDDRQKQQQEMMKLYKEEKINPMAGCLPVLMQMPVFIALYWMLAESVELRHAPFVLWIQDLSVKDPYFVLPILMGAIMYLQQKLNPTPPDPMQAKIMQMMPVIFTVFFIFFPAGLVLYWLFNSLISMIQQLYIYRGIEKASSK